VSESGEPGVLPLTVELVSSYFFYSLFFYYIFSCSLFFSFPFFSSFLFYFIFLRFFFSFQYLSLATSLTSWPPSANIAIKATIHQLGTRTATGLRSFGVTKPNVDMYCTGTSKKVLRNMQPTGWGG
jgi:hypothetical protein